MKKRTLYKIILIILILAAALSIYLYQKHTTSFSAMSSKDLEFESLKPSIFDHKDHSITIPQ